MGRYFTPRSASGISAMMISALKITADRIADCGVARCMMFSAFSTGNVPANIAGIIAKYLATSLAMEKVVRDPRVISSWVPIKIDHVAGLFGCLRSGVHSDAHVGLGQCGRIVGTIACHGDQFAFGLLAANEVHLVFGIGLGK